MTLVGSSPDWARPFNLWNAHRAGRLRDAVLVEGFDSEGIFLIHGQGAQLQTGIAVGKDLVVLVEFVVLNPPQDIVTHCSRNFFPRNEGVSRIGIPLNLKIGRRWRQFGIAMTKHPEVADGEMG